MRPAQACVCLLKYTACDIRMSGTQEDKEERDRLKAANWDDYKDENPRGAGNKKDNYFQR